MEGKGRGISLTQEETEFRETAYPDVSAVESLQLACTVCQADVKKQAINNSKVFSHIHLEVLLCKSCINFYGDGEFSIDEDGLDKYCRWCGQGGKLYICCECPTAFCKKCIKQNIDRSLWKSIKDDNWKCYICSPEPLYKHRALCWAVQKHIQTRKSTSQNAKPADDKKQQSEKGENGTDEVSSPPTVVIADDEEEENESDAMVKKYPKLGEHVKIARKWLKSAIKDLQDFTYNLSAKGDKIVKKDFVQRKMSTPSDIEKFVTKTTATLDSSITVLTNIRDTMGDYIKEWKVILDEAIEKEREKSKAAEAEKEEKDKKKNRDDKKKAVENNKEKKKDKDKDEEEKMDILQLNESEDDLHVTINSIIENSLNIEDENEDDDKRKDDGEKENEDKEKENEDNEKENEDKEKENEDNEKENEVNEKENEVNEKEIEDEEKKKKNDTLADQEDSRGGEDVENPSSKDAKPLLRVRNVEEVNKAISESKTGDLFDQVEADRKNDAGGSGDEVVVANGEERPEKDDDTEKRKEEASKEKKNALPDGKQEKNSEANKKVGTTENGTSSSSPVVNGVDVDDDDTATQEGGGEKNTAGSDNDSNGCDDVAETKAEESDPFEALLNKEAPPVGGHKSDEKSTKELSEETKKTDNEEEMNNEIMKSLLSKTTSEDSSSVSSIDLSSKTDETKSNRSKKKLKLSATKDKAKGASKKKSNVSLLSSSSDEIDKLLDISTLKKRPRKSGNSSSSSNSGKSKDSDGAAHKKKKLKSNNAKNSKNKSKETSILDMMESDNGDKDEINSSGSSLDLAKELGALKTLNESACTYEDVTREIYLASTPEFNSDSSSSEGEGDKDKKEKEKKKNKGNTEKSKKNATDNSSDDKGRSKGKSKADWRRNKMLTEKLTDTDSSEIEEKYKKFKNEREKKKRLNSSDSDKKTRRKKRNLKFSDSDSSVKIEEISSTDSSEEDAKKKESEQGQKKKRKRIQRMSTDSDSDKEKDPKLQDSASKGRKNIRKVLKEESLEHSTQEAIKEEQERKKRIAERQKLYNQMMKVETEKVTTLEKLVLDFDPDTKKELVTVDPDLVKKMKPHQAEGIKFIWDTCFESLKDAKKNKGSGCILAHCMGLGKSFQVVTIVHTLLTNTEVGVKTALVVCPLSTVLNWVNEFNKWLKDVGSGEDIAVYHLVKVQTTYRQYTIKDWFKNGGVMILGYTMYRQLTNPKMKGKASVRAVFQESLVDPGPDLVICDEGHVLKNESTALSKAMSRLKTKRRIVLTGTPLQNNLEEYHCMVQFVKPSLLGTKKEFKNRFVNPIQNGQFEDSTAHDVKVMKRRAHVLHKLLDGIVQRKDYNVLTPFLPPKLEYVISVNLTEVQCSLYQHYLDNYARGKDQGKTGATLFKDWLFLTRICTHPRVMLMHRDKELLKNESNGEESEGSLKDFIDDGSDSASSSSSSLDSKSGSASEKEQPTPAGRRTRSNPIAQEEEVVPEVETRKEWWFEIVNEEQMEDIRIGSKMVLLLSILKKCEEIGDKLLVFSQSLYTLDLIEYFLERIDEATQAGEVKESLCGCSGSWAKGLDYFRLDGQTASELRSSFIDRFNREANSRARLFLISTKAGGLGINLVGANRAVIFDASWNPSYDVQSIFRIYRFGQKKPCYVYRLLAQGTIEERIYERQVAKLSISCRVIDEQQVDRHFSHSDLTELYTFKPNQTPQSIPILPKDRLMAEMLQSHKDIISTYHHHDSLLENQEEEELNEEERRQAWTDFENEKKAPPPPQFQQSSYAYMLQNDLQQVLNSIAIKIQQQNPTMTAEQIQTNANLVLAQWRTSFQNSFQQQQQQQQQQARLWNQTIQAQQQQQSLLMRPNMMMNSGVGGGMPRFQATGGVGGLGGGIMGQPRPGFVSGVATGAITGTTPQQTSAAPLQASSLLNSSSSSLVVNPKAIKHNTKSSGTALALQQLLSANIQQQQQPTQVHEIDE